MSGFKIKTESEHIVLHSKHPPPEYEQKAPAPNTYEALVHLSEQVMNASYESQLDEAVLLCQHICKYEMCCFDTDEQFCGG